MQQSVFELASQLREEQKSFSIATIMNVRGSASAKPGSKAVFDSSGRNLMGWVGGGCAESYIGRQGVESIAERKPRTVVADLDDEVFGLGMPCGGVMDVFIEPFLPSSPITLQDLGKWNSEAEFYLSQLGFVAKFQTNLKNESQDQGPTDENTHIQTREELYLYLAVQIAKLRRKTATPMRSVPTGTTTIEATKQNAPPQILIVGNSRITEELASLSARLSWPTQVFGPEELNSENYPPAGELFELKKFKQSYDELYVQPFSVVIIASHHKGDVEFISKALQANAVYIGLVASRHRGEIVLQALQDKQVGADLAKVHVPTGLDLGCETPGEIALSVVAELILQKNIPKPNSKTI